MIATAGEVLLNFHDVHWAMHNAGRRFTEPGSGDAESIAGD